MAAPNGISRRRNSHRTTPLRDADEEDGEVELQETVRLRDQGSKRERDREFFGRNNPMNSNSSRRVVRSRGEREESMEEESVDGDDDTEGGGGSISRMLPPNATTATTSTFSVISNHNYQHHRGSKSLQPPPRVSRQTIPLKDASERIGVLVPRRARSACVKRSYENWVAGNGGFVEDQSQRRASLSPASRSGEEGSPSSSNVSIMKKMKPSGSKTRFPKVSKSTTSGQEDIEIEIAEVLFGLKRHSQTFKEESLENASQKFQSKEANGLSCDSKISSDATCAQTSILSEIRSSVSDPLRASKKLRGEDDSIQVQNSAVVSAIKGGRSALKLEVLPPKPGSNEVDAVPKASSQSSSLRAESNKREDSKPKIQESRVADKEKSASLEKESAVCTNIDVDLQDSTVTKVMPNISAKESKREKFKFDLMALPPMATSPEQHDIGSLLSLDSIPLTHDSVKVHSVPTDEEQEQRLITEAADLELGERITKIAGKNESKLDLQKLSQESCNDNGSKSQSNQQLIATISKVKATAQPSSVPLPIPVAGWPSGLPPLGYVPTVQTILPMDGIHIASAAVKNMNTQTRPKRCAVHQYIASNIRMHQQLLKTNHFWPAAALCGAKPHTLSTIPSAESMIIANPSFPVQNLNISLERGMATSNISVPNTKNRTSEDANCVVRLPQSSQPDPAGSLVHGQAFIFSPNQHQTSITASANQRRASKSTASINNVSLPGNVSGVAANPLAFPAAVSFSHPNLSNNEDPYLRILPNNSYPFPISTAVFRGGNPSQVLPFYNGSFYSSQMLHASQLQQQPPRSHHVVQPVHQNASASSGSSNRKQQQSTLPRVAHSSNNFSASTNMQAQQPHKYLPSHQSQKLEGEIRGESKLTGADTRKSLSKASVHGQNSVVPLQPNFTLIPSSTTCGSVKVSHGEKQQQQQFQAKKIQGGVERIPSQTFAMSFPSFNGSNIVSNLSFSPMAQNPAILQTLPETTRQANHVVSASKTSNKKDHRLFEGKKGGNSTNVDEGEKTSMGKSMISVGQTLAFDSAHRTLNFVSSPFPGTWPTQASSSTTTAIPASSSNSQQQHLLQLQNQHIVQQHQQQQQPAGVPRSKIVTNGHPSYPVGGKFSSNGPFLGQSHAQSNSAPQDMQWKNSPRTSAVSNPSAHKNVSQPLGRAPQGQIQISFGANSKSVSVPQGQQMTPINHASPTRATGSPPSGGNFKTTSMRTISNASAPAPQPAEVDASSSKNTQKSSPVCGRNVPSILNACPSHLSELKY